MTWTRVGLVLVALGALSVGLVLTLEYAVSGDHREGGSPVEGAEPAGTNPPNAVANVEPAHEPIAPDTRNAPAARPSLLGGSLRVPTFPSDQQPSLRPAREPAPLPVSGDARPPDPELTITEEGDRVWTADNGGIRRAVVEHMSEVRACFDQWIARDPKVPDRFQMTFYVDFAPKKDADAGSAPEVVFDDFKVEHPSEDRALMEGCFEKVLSGISFKPPAEEARRTQVIYPLYFETGRTRR